MNFERGKDPKKSIGIGKQAIYKQLREGSIIKLISNEGFDPDIDTAVGEQLAIHFIEPATSMKRGEDNMEIHYHALDDQGKTTGRSDSWIIDRDFFVEYFEIVRL